MFNSLPHDVQSLLQWSWADIEPYYRDLAGRSPTAVNVAEWLADWTAIDERVSEMYSRLHLSTTVNTADKAGEERFRSFLDRVQLPAEAEEQKLRERLLASGLEPKGFEVPPKKDAGRGRPVPRREPAPVG